MCVACSSSMIYVGVEADGWWPYKAVSYLLGKILQPSSFSVLSNSCLSFKVLFTFILYILYTFSIHSDLVQGYLLPRDRSQPRLDHVKLDQRKAIFRSFNFSLYLDDIGCSYSLGRFYDGSRF